MQALERLGKNLLDRLGLQVKHQHPQREAHILSQEFFKQRFLTNVGTTLFKNFDHPTQQRVSEIFAAQDVDGLRQLAEKYDLSTVEAISFALDAAVGSVIGEKSSYHTWATGVLQGQEKQPQR
jgi:hypothetical protein